MPATLNLVFGPIGAGKTTYAHALARRVALDALRRFRDGGCRPATPPGPRQLRQLMEGSRSVAPFRVTADYSYVRKEFASPRVLLAGDAACFLDPIFSSGVYLSTRSAQIAIEAIARAHAEERPLSRAEQRLALRA